jgi:hypothetical protein
MEEVFADGVGEVMLTGSVVRLDLVSLSLTEKDENGQPKIAFRQRVVMPVDGFVRSFGMMAQLMQQLEQKGVVRRGETPSREPAAQPAPGAKPASPNFTPR